MAPKCFRKSGHRFSGKKHEQAKAGASGKVGTGFPKQSRGRVTIEPFSQVGAWRQILVPAVQRGNLFLEAARSETIDQHPHAVAGPRVCRRRVRFRYEARPGFLNTSQTTAATRFRSDVTPAFRRKRKTRGDQIDMTRRNRQI